MPFFMNYLLATAFAAARLSYRSPSICVCVPDFAEHKKGDVPYNSGDSTTRARARVLQSNSLCALIKITLVQKYICSGWACLCVCWLSVVNNYLVFIEIHAHT